MNTTTDTRERLIAVADGLTAKVHSAGTGTPLLYLHGPAGHAWTPLHERLAARFTVHAPLHAGWDDPADLDQLDSLWDLVLYHLDLLDGLGLGRAVLAGHSVGAMVAAEIAATAPERVSGLALIAPYGLWRDELPVADLWGTHPATLPSLLWADPGGEAARANAASTDPDEMLASYVANTAAAHFVWPIPDRNLRRRLRRVSAPALLVWGRRDGIVPPQYAEDFAALLRSSETVLVDDAAHNVHLEASDAVAAAIIERFADAT